MNHSIDYLKVLLVSPVIPPSLTGQGLIIERLFQNWSTEKYVFVATQEKPANLKHSAEPLPAKYYLNSATSDYANLSHATTYLQKIKKYFSLLFRLPYFTYKILHIAQKTRATAIICCTGDPFALPACYISSKLLKKKLYLYVFDDYINQWSRPALLKFAKFFEKKSIQKITTVITVNQFLARIYQERYKINPIIIHNALSKNSRISGPRTVEQWGEKTLKVVFTGSIYYAQQNAFLNLINYMNKQTRHIELHLYTPQSKIDLEKMGIAHTQLYFHGYVAEPKAIEDILRDADVLFLPLSFSQRHSSIINTAAPGKMGEYLASGTPILVHAPRESFVSWYFQHYQCGIVVDDVLPSMFEKAFENFRYNPKQLEVISNNAIARARIDFEHAVMDKNFKNIFVTGYALP